MRFLVYALRDPITRELRYVGKTTTGLKRARAHTRPAALLERSHKASWVRSLLARGLCYEIVVLEVFSSEQGLSEAECQWIAVGRSALGQRLTNTTVGGDGRSGSKQTAETRAKIAAKLKGRTVSSETRDRLSVVNKKRLMTPEWLRYLRIASEKARSPEARARQRVAQTGVTLSAQHRERIGKGVRSYWASRRAGEVER